MSVTRSDVEGCENWKFLGFGNADAPIWIIGLEERGAEIRAGGLTIEDSVRLRRGFPITVDLRSTWFDSFRHPLSRLKQGTWWWAARLMLALQGNLDASAAEVRAYRDGGLGSLDGPCMLADLYPLPMNRRDAQWSYASTGLWKNWGEYRRTVGPVRARSLMREVWARPSVRVIIAYSAEVGAALFAAAGATATAVALPAGDGAAWTCLQVGDRRVHLGVTGFWGQGRYSKAELASLAVNLKSLGCGQPRSRRST